VLQILPYLRARPEIPRQSQRHFRGDIAPPREDVIVVSFPIERYADQLLPSWAAPKIHLLGQ